MIAGTAMVVDERVEGRFYSELRTAEIQAVYFECDGPENLLAPVEAEFAKRGLSPHAMTFS
jgi:hypothetical protein